MVFGDRAAEVDSGEGGEDERLQGGHQADLEREQRIPNGIVNQASAETPRITASAPAMNRMIRWPARMFANRRIVSDSSRIKFESTSRKKIERPPSHR